MRQAEINPAGMGASFMQGGGEMGARLRAFDWAQTSLGSPAAWPRSLQTAVRIMLTSRFAMWMAWGKDLIFFCNDAYLPTTGIKQSWALGARSDRLWAEIWPDIGPRINYVLETGEATWDEQLLLYLERSGYTEETYHTFSYSPLSDDSGDTAGILCVVAEVTKRVIGERQLATLRDSGARLAAQSTRDEVMGAFVACLAAEGRDLPFALVYLAQDGSDDVVLEARHGLPAGHPAAPSVIGLRDAHAAWPVGAAKSGHTAVKSGLSVCYDGLPAQHGQVAPDSALILPISRADGASPLGYLVAGLNPHRALDADYRGFLQLVAGQLAAAIARADEFAHQRARAETLAELDRAKTAFFSNVSHEFRTPLTLMLGPLEDALADAGTLPAAQTQRLRVVHRNGLRLLRLVNTLLDFARIEAGRAEARFQPVDLARLTAEIASTFQSVFDRAGLRLHVDCAKLGENVFVDRGMWEKILLNLLSNAFKFTLQGGVTVKQYKSGATAVLEVADTGVGIPAAELPRLFDRFHRVENAGGRSFEGSGIGLALVQELVELHGGNITADSQWGHGTVFRVTVPLGQAHLPPERVGGIANAAEPSWAREYVDEALRWLPAENGPDSDQTAPDDAPAREGEVGTRGRVIVADDNADLRDYVGGLLRARDYEVEAVADGQAAWEAVRRQRPDLLLTDVMMPRMDGFALLRAIRADAELADLPVVMLSARAGQEAQVDGLEAGADDYLSKPFTARELLARVSANLDMARVRRQAADAIRASESRLAVEREFLSHVLAKAPVGISITDMSGRMISINDRAVELLGHRHAPESIASFALFGGVHEDGRPYVAEEYATVRALQGEYVQGERLIYRRGGPDGESRIVLEIDAAPIRDAQGGQVGAVTIFGDADVRDRAEAALRVRVAEAVRDRETALAQLHEVAKLETIGQLTGGVAHDFNNLLTPIMGSLDLLARRLSDDPRARRHMDIAMQAAERARTLVQRLLAFARRTNLHARPVAVGELIAGMRGFLQSTIGVDVRLSIHVAADVPPALIDPNQLELVILNLCLNARDAMPGGGTLLLSADAQNAATLTCRLAPGEYVAVSVTDTGSGMDAQIMARAMEPFFTTKPQGQGTGLGLSMVHGLAAQSGGALVLESEVGRGTTATLYLPVAQDAPVDHLTSQLVVDRERPARRVLLVDDESIVRETTAEMLADHGFLVTQAGGGQEAIRLVEKGLRPHILVTDQKMPGMCGQDLAAALSRLLPNMKVLLISGYPTPEQDGIPRLSRLSKPFRQAELIARVDELCGRHEGAA